MCSRNINFVRYYIIFTSMLNIFLEAGSFVPLEVLFTTLYCFWSVCNIEAIKVSFIVLILGFSENYLRTKWIFTQSLDIALNL